MFEKKLSTLTVQLQSRYFAEAGSNEMKGILLLDYPK